MDSTFPAQIYEMHEVYRLCKMDLVHYADLLSNRKAFCSHRTNDSLPTDLFLTP
jgi:hypothetical protein